MNRIERCFADLERARRKALIAYLPIGDPSLDESLNLAQVALEAGADILELGVPFSDPTADGPAIARASQRAIAQGSTIERVIEIAGRLRQTTEAPFVLFSYYNPILVTGEVRIVSRSAAAGIDALLLVDLPPEEGSVLRQAASSAGLAMIPLVAPTSGATRLAAIAGASSPGAPSGFVYYVSMTGVTGAVPPELSRAAEKAKSLRAHFNQPVVVGFGIDGGASARLAAGAPGDGADGIVVGTAIVKRIEQAKTPTERIAAVRSLVTELREALDQ